jgi:hypothetical protein
MLPASRHVERELSWLSFNERVLDLAADPSTPLLERVRFMAIFSSNLDEFYMVRVASVLTNLEDGTPMTASPDIEPSEMMKEISRRTHELVARQSKILKSELLPELKKAGIEIVEWQELDSEERKHVSKVFKDYQSANHYGIKYQGKIIGLKTNETVEEEVDDEFDEGEKIIKFSSNFSINYFTYSAILIAFPFIFLLSL